MFHRTPSVLQSLIGLGYKKTHVEGRVTRRVARPPTAPHPPGALGATSAAAAAAGRRLLSSLLHPGAAATSDGGGGSGGGAPEPPGGGSSAEEEVFRFEGDLAGVVVLTDSATGEKRALWVGAAPLPSPGPSPGLASLPVACCARRL